MNYNVHIDDVRDINVLITFTIQNCKERYYVAMTDFRYNLTCLSYISTMDVYEIIDHNIHNNNRVHNRPDC